MKFLKFIIILLITSCTKEVESKIPALKEFDKSNNNYRIDSIELENVSTEGGIIIIHFDKESGRTIYDFQIYGENGKINYKYYTDLKMNFKVVEKKDYKYSKPITEKKFTVDSVIYYLNYKPKKILFDNNLQKVENKIILNKSFAEADTLFRNTIINNVRIRK